MESTEYVRRALLTHLPDSTFVQPFVYLRRDRPGRTASFIRYLNRLAARGAIERARIDGDHVDVFKYKADFPVIEHDETSESPEDVLDAALADDQPVVCSWATRCRRSCRPSIRSSRDGPSRGVSGSSPLLGEW